MSILSRLGRVFARGATEQKSFSLTDPEAFGLFGAVPSASGISVTAISAMRVPAVRRAVALIAESTATLPFKVYNSATREAAKDHPAYALVHREANPWTSAEELREQLTVDALLTGHGFAQVVRSTEGKPLELHRMDPGAVTIETDDFGEPSYKVRLKGGSETILPYHDVLHISALGGVAPIAHAREAIGLCIAAEKHLAGFYKHAGRPSGVILRPTSVGEGEKGAEVTKKIIRSWLFMVPESQRGECRRNCDSRRGHDLSADFWHQYRRAILREPP